MGQQSVTVILNLVVFSYVSRGYAWDGGLITRVDDTRGGAQYLILIRKVSCRALRAWYLFLGFEFPSSNRMRLKGRVLDDINLISCLQGLGMGFNSSVTTTLLIGYIHAADSQLITRRKNWPVMD